LSKTKKLIEMIYIHDCTECIFIDWDSGDPPVLCLLDKKVEIEPYMAGLSSGYPDDCPLCKKSVVITLGKKEKGETECNH
jgi:hypothetical protein